jgi:hypothetical protein
LNYFKDTSVFFGIAKVGEKFIFQNPLHFFLKDFSTFFFIFHKTLICIAFARKGKIQKA